MKTTLFELLSHFKFAKYIKTFYIVNSTDNISDYYTLEELVNYGFYRVVEWEFDILQNKLILEISYDNIKE